MSIVSMRVSVVGMSTGMGVEGEGRPAVRVRVRVTHVGHNSGVEGRNRQQKVKYCCWWQCYIPEVHSQLCRQGQTW
jgi:hypothetical protein